MKYGRIAYQGAIHPVTEAGTGVRLADGRQLAEGEFIWLPPLKVGTVFALGLNYADHARELAFKAPEVPLVFLKGPNTIIGLLPDGKMITCCDSKKLRPVVVGVNSDMVAIASEVCGLNAIMPDRDISNDIYPNEREMVVIDNDLAVQRWNQ